MCMIMPFTFTPNRTLETPRWWGAGGGDHKGRPTMGLVIQSGFCGDCTARRGRRGHSSRGILPAGTNCSVCAFFAPPLHVSVHGQIPSAVQISIKLIANGCRARDRPRASCAAHEPQRSDMTVFFFFFLINQLKLWGQVRWQPTATKSSD